MYVDGKGPRDFGGRFGKSCRTEPGKAMITQDEHVVLKALGGYRSRTQPSPAAANGLRSSPVKKDDSIALESLALSLSRGKCGSPRCGGPGGPGRPSAPPGFVVMRYVPVLGQRIAAGISGALSIGQRRASLRIQGVSIHR